MSNNLVKKRSHIVIIKEIKAEIKNLRLLKFKCKDKIQKYKLEAQISNLRKEVTYYRNT